MKIFKGAIWIVSILVLLACNLGASSPKPAPATSPIPPTTAPPTQAGIAFNQVYQWLVGTEMSQPRSSTSDGTWTCFLTRSNGYRALEI